ncbi:hypothetical protein [Aminivibrio sp.]|uniref:hypothetical protein n=1 Tax=Aminivibrio sp. TaxID=1872489 RepID=UPI001A539315|nr:hypothetical protein [Aminivibrio sp.]MBL3538243.1 hypothetical protein [Aminivibrio sp.]
MEKVIKNAKKVAKTKKVKNVLLETDFNKAWTEFFQSKKIPAERFFKNISAGTKKDLLDVPIDVSFKEELVTVYFSRSNNIDRLLDLLQNVHRSGKQFQGFLTDLCESVLRGDASISFPARMDPGIFQEFLFSWIGSLGKRKIKIADFKKLLLFLHFGSLKALIDHTTAREAINTVLTKGRKKSGISGEKLSELELMLCCPPQQEFYSCLLAYSESLFFSVENFRTEIKNQKSPNTEKPKDNNLNELVECLQRENKEKTEELVQIKEAYQFQLEELKGKIRGMMQDEIARWLDMAFAASNAEPPRINVVRERIEDTLKLIEKGKAWLQPLG